jgi:hypothetical protein
VIIFFVGYFNDIPSIIFFGPLNDIFGSLEAILSAVLATIFLFSGPKTMDLAKSNWGCTHMDRLIYRHTRFADGWWNHPQERGRHP